MAPLPPASADRRVLRLSPHDNVGVATTALDAGQSILIEGQEIVMRQPIATGHKIALQPIAVGQKVLKYGAPIGSATRPIQPGEHVHTHNLKSDYLPTYTLEEGRSYLNKTEASQ